MLISNQADIQRYYKALLERDSNYVGIFYVGVKSTGIFCISTCRARKPKFENVVFYTEVKELLQNGFRPCKICNPTQQTSDTPPDVSKAIKMVHRNTSKRVKDSELRAAGIKPEKVRRWFKANHDITFQAYQRMLRINAAFESLRNGKNVTESAFHSGYDSLSGFGYTFKNITGSSPKDGAGKDVILISRFNTVLGPMFVCATKKGICLLEFTDRRMLETEFGDLQKRLNAVILAGENDHIKQAIQEITEYFNGKRTQFEVNLDTPGTDFQQSVWKQLQKIPYGKTRSYQEQAELINNPKAVRAVASANGHNRVAIIIPCHRVIGKDGSLTGYAGGLERKRWLLNHETEIASNLNSNTL